MLKLKTVLTLSILAILTACGGDKTDNGATSAKSSQTTVSSTQAKEYPEAKVGVSISSIATNPFFQNMHRVYGEIDKEQEPLTVFLASADNSQETQNKQLENMVTQGAKALVVNLADVKQGAEVVQYWCAKNIPVVYFNRSPGAKNLASCPTAYFVDGDVTQAGVFQGIQILQAWQKNEMWDKNKDGMIQYAMLMGLPEHEGSMQRTKWSVKTLETYPQMGRKTEKIFEDFGMFQTVKAEELVSSWMKLPEFAKVEVILANNDTMALGALNALQKENMKLPIFGIDGSRAALESVVAGGLAGTVFNDFNGQAQASLRMAANLAAGKDVMEGLNAHLERKTVIIPALDINKDNLQEFMNNYR